MAVPTPATTSVGGAVTTFVPLLTKDQIEALPVRAREVVEYRKSGLSLNHVQGCPLDCAYCIRHTYGVWDMRQPRAVTDDASAVRALVEHPYFQPDVTPIQVFNRATDPMLPRVKNHVFAVLTDLDARGLRNHVLLITRYRMTAQDCQRLNELVNVKLTLLFTYSGIDDTRIGEGVRALALAGRWTDAAQHARTHNGIGVHLMEGRQAAIIAHCVQGDLPRGRALLAQSTPTQPWEQEIAACLHMMCTEPTDPLMAHHLTTAITRFTARTPTAGYASYRARLGLTIATLASATHPELAKELLGRTAEEAIDSADGYAARDVLGFREPIDGITERQRGRLSRLAAQSGLGVGTLPEPTLQRLTAEAHAAVAVLDSALCSSG